MKRKWISVLSVIWLFLIFFMQSCVQNKGTSQVYSVSSNTLITRTETSMVTNTKQPPLTKIPADVRTRETELFGEATITPKPILSLAVLKSISSGDYLVYTDKQGLEISSASGENRQFLAPIADDWTMLSPDKRFIAYSKVGIPYLYDIKANHEVKLKYTGGICITPDWSPDSQKVIFSCHINEGYDLVVFFTSDLSYQRIVDCEQQMTFCQMPKWSPDGNKIAYIRKPSYSGKSEITGLYVLNTECIIKKNCGTGYGPFPFMNAYTWSFDSRQLAGLSHDKLFIFNYDEGKLSIADTLEHIETGEQLFGLLMVNF
jgi:Tol biopolymer transport system component